MYKNLCFIFFMFSACQVSHNHQQESKLSQANQALYDEVIKIHDEVMPKQSLIAKYRDTLDIELKDKQIQKDSILLSKYQQIRQELNYAYQAMNLWMQEFEADYEGKSEEEIRAYLQKEKEKISKVGEKMRNSLEAAKTRKNQ